MKELLAPAGDFETLKQAIHNGCDAVYLGGKKFGARKFSTNFDTDEIIKAIRYCHLYGVKIYVTVNTIIFEEEVDECLKYLTFLHENGVDAVIMQDLGMISLTRKILPNLDIHVSTQAHTHNIEQIKLFEELGVTRVVLAREMSLDEISRLDTNLELEVFIHGALCVCYSGQCLFSSLLLNRSGNRGECAGICRLPFTLLEDGKEVETSGKYLLSPKELNTTNHIKELLASNITSFKIEGRMKSPTTIGFITRMYRMLIDHANRNEEISLTTEEQENLMLLFNRGFTEGYLFDKSGKEMMNIKSPNHIGLPLGEVISFDSKKIKIKLTRDVNQEDGIRFENSQKGMILNFIYDEKGKLTSGAKKGEVIEVDNKINLTEADKVLKTTDKLLLSSLESYTEKKIPLDIEASTINNKTFRLVLTDNENTIQVESDIVEPANNSGTSVDRIISQISKLGDTPFTVNTCKAKIEDNIFIPISKLNELRREATSKLIEIRENKKKEVIINQLSASVNKPINNQPISISALIRTEEQLEVCLKEGINIIYTPDKNLYDSYKDKINIYLRLDRVLTNHKDYDHENLLISELGSINKYNKTNNLISDYYLNVTNTNTINYLRSKSIKTITLSIENKLETIKNIATNTNPNDLEIIIYGYPEVMITKYCPLKMLVNDDKVPCSICHNNKKYELLDRNFEKYPLIQSNELTHIFYYRPIELENDIEELSKVGIKRYRFEFFDENSNQLEAIIKKYKTLLSKLN